MSDSGSVNGDQNEEQDSLFSRSPSVAEESDEARWRASEPPEEIFGEGEWKYQIIGEEVDYEGNIKYEVEWEDWEREDHSNVTWETEDTSFIDTKQWKMEQQRIRNDLASRSLSVDVITTTDIHNTDTYLRIDAYEEKLNRYRKQPPTNPFQEMEQLMYKHREILNPSANPQAEMSQSSTQGSSMSPFQLRMSQRASTRQQAEHSLAGSSRSTSSRASSRFPSVSASVLPHPFSSSSSSSSSTTQLSVNSSTSQGHQSPNPSTSSKKGKEKEVLRPYEKLTSNHWNPTHLIREASSPLSERSSVTVDSDIPQKPKRRSRQYDSEDSMSTLVLGRTPRKRMRRIINSGSEDDGRRISPSMSVDLQADSSSNTDGILNSLHRREELKQNWNTQAQNANAAPIYIVNEIDEEEVPDLDSSFGYLESIYEYSPDVEKPPDDFLIFCSCRRCTKATLCECQQPSELVDEQGLPFFAYQSGLFKFNVPRGIEVIECNKFCECSKDPRNCLNRVSQKPRQHPIEVFKTQMCGWGVRSTQPVKRGQVLGLYTGLVITREHANALPEHHAQYRFDLDGDESGDQEVELNHPRYSVDSRLCGNWTRFINHSCSPNLQIYLVVHDTPPGVGLPYIVFVANQHIPIGKEFTFDYNPSKPVTSSQDSDRGEPCRCGAENCRGYY